MSTFIWASSPSVSHATKRVLDYDIIVTNRKTDYLKMTKTWPVKVSDVNCLGHKIKISL